MEISPAVNTPRAGDPITAAWAADLAAAVDSAANPAEHVGAVSSPFGKASPAPGLAMLGDAKEIMAFDCALFAESGGSTGIYCAVPSDVAEWVWLGDKAIQPSQAQILGDGDTAFIRIAEAGASPKYVYLGFEGHETEPDEEGKTEVEVTGWRVYASDSIGAREEWIAPGTPLVLLATAKIPNDGAGSPPALRLGLVQYHRGTILAPFLPVEGQEDPDENPPPCGNPLNETSDYNPLNDPAWSGGSGGGGGVEKNPLDDPGEGGYTPTCREEAA